jgi:hypothetical protein
MARPQPNTRLETLLVQFGQQSGVSPDQAAQLRAAMTSDVQLLGRLNQAAQAGHLKGFALSAAGAAAPVGRYDLGTGVVSLPPAAFQPAGATASADLHAVLRVQEMVVRFGHGAYTDPPQPGASAPPATHPVSQEMLDNLQSTLNGSPTLAGQIKAASTTRDPRAASAMLLENFGFVPSNLAAGGTYNAGTHTMGLPVRGLQTKTAANSRGRFKKMI